MSTSEKPTFRKVEREFPNEVWLVLSPKYSHTPLLLTHEEDVQMAQEAGWVVEKYERRS